MLVLKHHLGYWQSKIHFWIFSKTTKTKKYFFIFRFLFFQRVLWLITVSFFHHSMQQKRHGLIENFIISTKLWQFSSSVVIKLFFLFFCEKLVNTRFTRIGGLIYYIKTFKSLVYCNSFTVNWCQKLGSNISVYLVRVKRASNLQLGHDT